MMLIPVFNKFCYCLSLVGGVIFIGWFNVIVGVFFLISSIINIPDMSPVNVTALFNSDEFNSLKICVFRFPTFRQYTNVNKNFISYIQITLQCQWQVRLPSSSRLHVQSSWLKAQKRYENPIYVANNRFYIFFLKNNEKLMLPWMVVNVVAIFGNGGIILMLLCYVPTAIPLIFLCCTGKWFWI
jgi:hypothetical protein